MHCDLPANRLTLQPSSNARHRMTIAGTYDLPFGKGHKFLTNAHPVIQAILGGWSTSWAW